MVLIGFDPSNIMAPWWHHQTWDFSRSLHKPMIIKVQLKLPPWVIEIQGGPQNEVPPKGEPDSGADATLEDCHFFMETMQFWTLIRRRVHFWKDSRPLRSSPKIRGSKGNPKSLIAANTVPPGSFCLRIFVGESSAPVEVPLGWGKHSVESSSEFSSWASRSQLYKPDIIQLSTSRSQTDLS